MTLGGRTVLVTGANRGIGQALVEEASARGAKRVYAGTRQPLAHSDPRVTPLTLDVTDPSQIQAAVERVQSLDVLINNAGVDLHGDLGDRALLERHLAVNLIGTYGVTQAFLPLLTRSRGAIVNMLSLAAVAPLPFTPTYSISKAAAFSLSQSLRALLAGPGVSVHAVLAGPVDTEMTRGLDVPKTSPESVARAIFDGLEQGGRRSSPIPCQRPWRRAGAAVRRRSSSASLRHTSNQSPSSHDRSDAFHPRLEDSMSDLSDKTTIVVGASRGLGRGIATAFAEAGAPVVAVSRTAAEFPGPADGAGSIQPEVADAGDPTVAGSLLDRYEPRAVILVAGATPHMLPLQEQTWETFSVNWETDVRIAFHWLREALLRPLRPGSRVVVVSSGAAVNPNGSPLSGGYAGAKATQRLITAYAQGEAERAGLDLTFTAVLPKFAPTTAVGRSATQAYAARAGQPVEEYLEQLDTVITPEIAGDAMVELVRADAADVASAYVLTGGGLQKLP
jgi:NAD(P)-dependent dehydrogenase (short-subunit alcohol dehydrogenase family)